MPRARPSLSITSNAAGKLSSSSSAGPSSPTFSETTNISQMNLNNGPEKIITRADLKISLQGFDYLVKACASYRVALLEMSKATAAFADALQTCSGLKGASYDSGTRLQAAAGLHHLMGNQWHVLSAVLDKNFEVPLRQYLENYRRIVSERSVLYEKSLLEKSRKIKQIELEHMNIGKKKQPHRNLQTFRETLATLQRHVDELDVLKASHYQEIYEHEDEVWDFVQGKVCLAVRSSLDIFDRFASKASDPVLEPMLNSVPDPFDSYGPPKAEDEIFSILPPLAILNHAPSSSPSPLVSTPVVEIRQELDNTEMTVQSLVTPWIENTQHYSHFSSTEWTDAISPRSTSPPSGGSPITATKTTTIASPAEMTRQHSDPIIATSMKNGSHSRKAEATLRSVLSVIDERPGPSHPQEDSTGTNRGDLIEIPAQSRIIRNNAAAPNGINEEWQNTGRPPVEAKDYTSLPRSLSPQSDETVR